MQWMGPDGKRHGKSFALNCRREAKRFAGQQDAQRKEARSGIDLETAVVLYLEDRESVCALGTWTRYESVLTQFVDWAGRCGLGTVSTQKISEWRNARLEKLARTTVRNDLKCLKAFFRWCKARKWIVEDPSAAVDTPKCKRVLPRFLTPELAEKLLDAMKQDAPAEFHLIALFALRAGMRRNEILTLPWDKVNFEQGLLTVSGKSIEERVIPLHPELANRLMDWPQDGPMVFPAKYRVENNVRSPDIAKRFNQWLKEHGWDITLHGLRHSFAVGCVSRGASERAVGDLLGHQDVRTTRIYARSYQDHLREIVVGAAASPGPSAKPSARSATKGKPALP